MTLLDDMLKHAEDDYPNECCGLVVSSGKRHRLVRGVNTATHPHVDFRLGPEVWLGVEPGEEVVAVYHSHPNYVPQPSLSDLSRCEAHGLPWHIVSWPGRGHYYFEPSGFQAPLEGRPYVHGVHDCYAIVRDWYQREEGIELTDYIRQDYWWEVDGENLYVDNFEREGFVVLPDDATILRGDVMLIQFQAKVVNHAMVALGDGTCLHHVLGRLSRIEPFDGYWQKHCVYHLRHNRKMGTTAHG
jgi:proteasome lid subunit RPN8/RPN11